MEKRKSERNRKWNNEKMKRQKKRRLVMKTREYNKTNKWNWILTPFSKRFAEPNAKSWKETMKTEGKQKGTRI